jgi:hypothetical protein
VKGLPPRLLRHPNTRLGYFARKVGGVLPCTREPTEICEAQQSKASRGPKFPISCSNSTASSRRDRVNSTSGRSTQKALQKTAQHGMGNSSMVARPHLYIAYVADGGMANQAISHWNAMAAAIALGAKGIVSPTVLR